MAREVYGTHIEWNEAQLERLNSLDALIRADEREACAKVCDDIDAEYKGEDVLATWCSRAIRERVKNDKKKKL